MRGNGVVGRAYEGSTIIGIEWARRVWMVAADRASLGGKEAKGMWQAALSGNRPARDRIEEIAGIRLDV